MPKLLCLALGHRFRVVQEFSPQCRRMKCEQCGGDWGMNDADDRLGIKPALVEWDLDFEQFFRDRGFEILEPVGPRPLTRPELIRELTWAEMLHASRWPGAFAMVVSFLASLILHAVGIEHLWHVIAVFAITFAIMNSLMPSAYRRAYERKRNTLEA